MTLSFKFLTVDKTTFLFTPAFYLSWSPRFEFGVAWGLWGFAVRVSRE